MLSTLCIPVRLSFFTNHGNSRTSASAWSDQSVDVIGMRLEAAENRLLVLDSEVKLSAFWTGSASSYTPKHESPSVFVCVGLCLLHNHA